MRRQSFSTKHGTLTVDREGADRVSLRDVYAFILSMRWRNLFAAFLGVYVAINALFAGLFVLGGPCIKGARTGSFVDAFFFSIQTLSTIGYGQMSPITNYAEVIVSIESFVGIVGVAVATGIIFTKFARPTSGMVFTEKAVVHHRHGVPSLVFRVANARGGEIVEASIRATALLDEETQEGHRMRRLHDLKLIRDVNPILLMSWTVVHPIDEDSPLYGLSEHDLHDQDVRFIMNVTGIDGTFMQSVYAYQLYLAADIVFEHTFADVVVPQDDIGTRFTLDMTRFNELVPCEDGRVRQD
ncbi:MAG: ion channel [Myxococcota bacterium]